MSIVIINRSNTKGTCIQDTKESSLPGEKILVREKSFAREIFPSCVSSHLLLEVVGSGACRLLTHFLCAAMYGKAQSESCAG